MTHPYKAAPDRAFWKRAFPDGWTIDGLDVDIPLIREGERIASAGSCFAANIVPFLERAGFNYIRREVPPRMFQDVAGDHFNYSRFSAAYGNIYTVRQAMQMVKRALGRFKPKEDRWALGDTLVVDPFRPGMKFPAMSHREFDLLTAQHLANVLGVIRDADVFVFTLGLTEAWISKMDGAVFPACPGTVAGTFDTDRHAFCNFSVSEVRADLEEFVDLLREINPLIRLILTVSPVPLVATATGQHVLVANTLSKSVLRVAAGEVAQNKQDVAYFPAYEIVTGPQAPADFFESDRREPSTKAIAAVMQAFLSRCQAGIPTITEAGTETRVTPASRVEASDSTSQSFSAHLSNLVAQAQCEEAAAGL